MKDMKIIIREWVPNIENEFRCFYHGGHFRGITGFNTSLLPLLCEIKKEMNNISHYCEYDDFTADFGVVDNKLMLIEINTPVYLCGTSGNFDLDVPFDYEILLGNYLPDVISYPVIK